MSRYRGKREAPRPERGFGRREEDPFQQDPFLQEEPENVREVEPLAAEDFTNTVGDPFTEEEPSGGGKERLKAALGRFGAFWLTRKGKILAGVLTVLVLLVVAVGIFIKSWVKPPDLPVAPDAGQQEQQRPDTGEEEPEDTAPTDDELYPDDGYDGDMPTVSGDRKEGVYTFLLVGTDKGDGNTDTIMVATYDTVNQDVSIMSIPRDTMINASWDIKKINSVYSRYSDGIGALKKQVKTLIGFTPDFYVKVDLEMFVELVDLVGGVEFYVPQDMNYDDDWQDLHIHLEEGLQVLDGEKAMELVRFRRYAEGDIKRVEVQQNFMKALIKECLSLEHWGKIKAYIDLAMDNVQTDLEFGSVVWFAAQALGLNGTKALSMDDVYTCTLPANYYASAWSRSTGNEQSYVTIYPNQVVELVNERFNPYEQKVTTGMLDAMSILSNGDIASSTGSVRDTQHNALMAVQRGEAYYDDNGNIVYGKPPVKPEIDAFGNYYILDDSGNIVYTDENGTALDPQPIFPDPTNPGDTDPSGTGDQEEFYPPWLGGSEETDTDTEDTNSSDSGHSGGDTTDSGSSDPGVTDPDTTDPGTTDQNEGTNEEPPGWL